MNEEQKQKRQFYFYIAQRVCSCIMFIRWIVENVLLRSKYMETLFFDVHLYFHMLEL